MFSPSLLSRFRRFLRDRAGAAAMPFALSVVGIGAVVASTADYGRASLAKSVLENALDAATLAAARDLADAPKTQAQVQARVENQLAANLAANGEAITVTSVTATIDAVNGRILTSAAGYLPAAFPGIVGRTEMMLGASASSTYESKTIELAMVLDVTGSMSGSKIADLKTAATNMVDTLLPADGRNDARIRVSLVPFAAAVNAGTYADLVRVSRSGGYGHTCVTEAGNDGFSDPNPTSPKTLRGDTSSCPSARVLPLTNNRTSLLNRIASFTASGNTAGHLGVRWGWFSVSPNWASIWPSASDPAAYGTPKLLKIIVFMTDGDFNQQYASGNGSSNQQALSICANAKAAGVSIYTVAFSSASAPLSATGANLMRTCASAPKQYFAVGNGAELIDAFRTIAAQVQMIYLTS